MVQRILVGIIIFLVVVAVIYLLVRKFRSRQTCEECRCPGAESSHAPDAQEVMLHVPGIHCANCEATVTRSLQGVDGVRAVKADHVQKSVRVTYQGDQDTVKAVREQLERVGFPAD